MNEDEYFEIDAEILTYLTEDNEKNKVDKAIKKILNSYFNVPYTKMENKTILDSGIEEFCNQDVKKIYKLNAFNFFINYLSYEEFIYFINYESNWIKKDYRNNPKLLKSVNFNMNNVSKFAYLISNVHYENEKFNKLESIENLSILESIVRAMKDDVNIEYLNKIKLIFTKFGDLLDMNKLTEKQIAKINAIQKKLKVEIRENKQIEKDFFIEENQSIKIIKINMNEISDSMLLDFDKIKRSIFTTLKCCKKNKLFDYYVKSEYKGILTCLVFPLNNQIDYNLSLNVFKKMSSFVLNLDIEKMNIKDLKNTLDNKFKFQFLNEKINLNAKEEITTKKKVKI